MHNSYLKRTSSLSPKQPVGSLGSSRLFSHFYSSFSQSSLLFSSTSSIHLSSIRLAVTISDNTLCLMCLRPKLSNAVLLKFLIQTGRISFFVLHCILSLLYIKFITEKSGQILYSYFEWYVSHSFEFLIN